MTTLKVLRPVRLRLHGKARTWQAGEILTLDSAQADAVSASPLADAFRPLAPVEVERRNAKARVVVDRYFRTVAVPAMARLYREGKLRDDALDSPEWRAVEGEWVKASEGSPLPCDAARVVFGMAGFLGLKFDPIEVTAPQPEESARAVRVRNVRTGQEVVVTSNVLDEWTADGFWKEVKRQGGTKA